MGGTFMTIVYGFGGLRLKEQGISIWPILPERWTKYTFTILFENSRIKISLSATECVVKLEKGRHKSIKIYGKPYMLTNQLSVKPPAKRGMKKHALPSSNI
jgi:alpha,alpha-trehalose phosphorylase